MYAGWRSTTGDTFIAAASGAGGGGSATVGAVANNKRKRAGLLTTIAQRVSVTFSETDTYAIAHARRLETLGDGDLSERLHTEPMSIRTRSRAVCVWLPRQRKNHLEISQ